MGLTTVSPLISMLQSPADLFPLHYKSCSVKNLQKEGTQDQSFPSTTDRLFQTGTRHLLFEGLSTLTFDVVTKYLLPREE